MNITTTISLCTCGAIGEPHVHAYDDVIPWRDYQRPLRIRDAEHARALREMQQTLPWGAHNYSQAFQSYPVPHRDFAHALLHVLKAAGKLSIAVDDADHSDTPEEAFKPESVDRFIADLVICAFRLANTCPGRVIDLQQAIEVRMGEKFPKEK